MRALRTTAAAVPLITFGTSEIQVDRRHVRGKGESKNLDLSQLSVSGVEVPNSCFAGEACQSTNQSKSIFAERVMTTGLTAR